MHRSLSRCGTRPKRRQPQARGLRSLSPPPRRARSGASASSAMVSGRATAAGQLGAPGGPRTDRFADLVVSGLCGTPRRRGVPGRRTGRHWTAERYQAAQGEWAALEIALLPGYFGYLQRSLLNMMVMQFLRDIIGAARCVVAASRVCVVARVVLARDLWGHRGEARPRMRSAAGAAQTAWPGMGGRGGRARRRRRRPSYGMRSPGVGGCGRKRDSRRRRVVHTSSTMMRGDAPPRNAAPRRPATPRDPRTRRPRVPFGPRGGGGGDHRRDEAPGPLRRAVGQAAHLGQGLQGHAPPRPRGGATARRAPGV